MTIDFEKDQQDAMKRTDNIQSLADQVERLEGVASDIDAAEEKLKELKKKRDYISGEIIPTMMSEMGLAELKDIPVRKLSSGQRRRVALSRLLITQAGLWILDEPFTALDSSGKLITHQLIDKRTQEKGITVIVTHEDLNIPGNKIIKLVL